MTNFSFRKNGPDKGAGTPVIWTDMFHNTAYFHYHHFTHYLDRDEEGEYDDDLEDEKQDDDQGQDQYQIL